MAEATDRLIADLRRNEPTVHAIANALMRDKVLRGRKLAALLRTAQGSMPGDHLILSPREYSPME
jgi:hypothetical protein